MSSHKILKIFLVSCTLTLVGGVSLAATTTAINRPPIQRPQYTAAQQTCITNTVKTEQAAMKAAQDTFNAATANALATKQAAIKAAQDTFNAATKDALAAQQTAIKAAQAIKDVKSRITAINAAQNTYKNNSSVKQAVQTLTLR